MGNPAPAPWTWAVIMTATPKWPPMTIEAARTILASDPTWRATRDERERELLETIGDPASVAEKMHMWTETQARQVQGGPAILARRRNLPPDLPPADLPPPILRPGAIPSGILREAVDLATRDSEADLAAVLATMLTRFAAEIGSGPHYMVGETRHPARLYCLVVGSTSKARKGTSAAPVRALWNGSGLTVTPGPVSSGEGIIWAVRDPIKQWKPDKDGAGGQWITTDPGAEDKRLLIQTEELASAFKAMKREGNTASTTLRELMGPWERCPPHQDLPHPHHRRTRHPAGTHHGGRTDGHASGPGRIHRPAESLPAGLCPAAAADPPPGTHGRAGGQGNPPSPDQAGRAGPDRGQADHDRRCP